MNLISIGIPGTDDAVAVEAGDGFATLLLTLADDVYVMMPIDQAEALYHALAEWFDEEAA
jgi:hypothetical protein